MFARREVPTELVRVAERQSGVLSRRQALGHGLTDEVIGRLVRDGRWRRFAEGIYATREDSWEMRAAAGVLIAGPGAVLGLEAAGYLQRLITRPPQRIVVFVQRQMRRDDRWRFVRSFRDGVGTPPRTRYERTIIDLARTLTPDGVAALLAHAVRDRSLPARILAELDALPRHPNRKLIADILADVMSGAESALEVRYLRDVERPHLPSAIRQARPSSLYRSDVWYERYGLIIELDGRVHHEGLAASADMDRDNLHRLEGCVTLRLGWRQVAGFPCQTARHVAEALRQRGWTGQFRRCHRCGAP